MFFDRYKWLKEIGEWIIAFIIAYLIYVTINFFLGTVSGVKQISMYPTAKEGEKVIIQRPTLFKKELERGMIITFDAPLDIAEKTPDNIAIFPKYEGIKKFAYDFLGINKKSYIKRIIGLPGDRVQVAEDGTVILNGNPYEEPYLNPDKRSLPGKYMDVVVPDGCVFAMGDNRGYSGDSREFGCIPEEKINGYVISRIWPLNKMGKI